jgi:hypothetical protein
LKSRTFSIWEGSNAFSTGQAWTNAHLIKGIECIKKETIQRSVAQFADCIDRPENLRAEGPNLRSDQIKYWIGCVYEALGQKENAISILQQVAVTDTLKSYGMRGFGNSQIQLYFFNDGQEKA